MFLLKITVPVIYSGGSPILAGLAMVLVSTAVTVFLIYGLSPRGVLGIGVVLAGEFVACGLFLLFSLLLHLSGFKSSDAENLLVAAQNTGLNISTVLFAATMIASLGAVMDVAVSLLSALWEVRLADPDITGRGLWRAGLRMGRDMIGTMSNTLIFAFAGGSLTTLLVLMTYGTDPVQLLHSDYIALEMAHGLCGTCAVILTVPWPPWSLRRCIPSGEPLSCLRFLNKVVRMSVRRESMLHKNAKKVISGVLGTCLVFQLAALPSLAQTSNVPDQTQTAVTAQENSGVQTLASTSFTDVLLSVGANNTQMNATWYAAQEGAGYVLVAKQSQLVNGAMPENAAKFDATSTPANESGKWSNQATITGLEPGTVYAYQLVNGEEKSDVATFTTATNGAFSFAFAGDPQIGASGNADSDTRGWDKTLGIIADSTQFDGVDFLLSAGDQVNTASNEDQYNGYLDHDELLSLPVATVVGNHDSSSNAYDQHFNVPNESELGVTNAGGNYWFVYNNTLFLAQQQQPSTADHKAFMEEAIAANDVSWKMSPSTTPSTLWPATPPKVIS